MSDLPCLFPSACSCFSSSILDKSRPSVVICVSKTSLVVDVAVIFSEPYREN